MQQAFCQCVKACAFGHSMSPGRPNRCCKLLYMLYLTALVVGTGCFAGHPLIHVAAAGQHAEPGPASAPQPGSLSVYQQQPTPDAGVSVLQQPAPQAAFNAGVDRSAAPHRWCTGWPKQPGFPSGPQQQLLQQPAFRGAAGEQPSVAGMSMGGHRAAAPAPAGQPGMGSQSAQPGQQRATAEGLQCMLYEYIAKGGRPVDLAQQGRPWCATLVHWKWLGRCQWLRNSARVSS